MDSHALGDRYEIVDRIGTGGMASVYLARDTLLSRNVAIKILHEAYAADPTFIERFRREAQAAAGLNHPNVVTIYDWGEAFGREPGDETRSFLVMEYIPGPNLKDVLRQRGPLPEAEALNIAAEVASALDAAHRQGIIHRDVKPHNVLIDPLGRAKVTDFGISHAAGLAQLTAPDVVSGTAHYISPEQAQRGPLDGRSDLYSLGVMLYELLTGRLPFEGETLVEVALQQLRQPPSPPRTYRPDISAATEAVVLKSLAKEPGQRFANAAVMRDALLSARSRLARSDQAGEDTTVMAGLAQADLTQEMLRQGTARLGSLPVGPRPRVRRSQPTRPAVWMALPLVLLLLVIGGAAVYVLGGNGSGHHSPGPVAVAPHGHATATPGQARPTPAATHRVTIPTSVPRPHPTATHAPAPTATSALSTPTPVSATATSVPPQSSPTAQVAAVSKAAGNPAETVAAFYADVAQHHFSQAAALWSSNMLSQFDPNENINGRFANTRRIDLRSNRVVSQTATQATVAVDFVETTSDGPNELAGSWTLVPGPNGGWLMDSPHFEE